MQMNKKKIATISAIIIASLIFINIPIIPVTNPSNGTTVVVGIGVNVYLQYRAYNQYHVNQTLVNEGWKPLGNVTINNIHYFAYNYSDHNKVVNVMGLTWLSNKIFTTAYENTSTVAQFIGLSSDTGTPAFTDTSLASEITTNGLGRASCTITIGTASGGVITDQCVNTFTDTTSTTSNVQKAGWFINNVAHCAAASPTGNGCMWAENTFGSTTLNVNDQLQITWKAIFTST